MATKSMIPAFDDAGNLPPGIHEVSWDEIETRFATHDHRRVIYDNLRSWARHMQMAGCQVIYVDGSFVTSKELPADFDACWDIRGVDRGKLAGCLLGQRLSDEREIKTIFGGDVRIDYAYPPGSISRYIDFFMRDGRNGGRPKGILKVTLRQPDFVEGTEP